MVTPHLRGLCERIVGEGGEIRVEDHDKTQWRQQWQPWWLHTPLCVIGKGGVEHDGGS